MVREYAVTVEIGAVEYGDSERTSVLPPIAELAKYRNKTNVVPNISNKT